MRLFRTIATSAAIAAELSAYGRRVTLQDAGNLALVESRLLQGVNLVSFFLGEVCVVHLRNFDWLVKKASMLPHPSRLTRITQNGTSSLNPPYEASDSLLIFCENKSSFALVFITK